MSSHPIARTCRFGVTAKCGCKWSFSELANYKSTFCTGVEAVVSTTVVFEACLTCWVRLRLTDKSAVALISSTVTSTHCSADQPQTSRDSWAQSFQPHCSIFQILLYLLCTQVRLWPSQDSSFPASAFDTFDAGAGLSLFGTSFVA